MNLINVKLYNGDKLINKYNNIPCIIKDDKLSFILDNIKTTINNEIFIRETPEYLFKLHLNKKECTYTLKEKESTFDIEVEELTYRRKLKHLELIYKIISNDEIIKLIIEIKD